MVDGVYHRLLDCRPRKVQEALGLWSIRVLDDRLFQVVAVDVLDGVARNASERSLKNLFLEAVAARSFGKPDHVDLSRRKKSLGRIVEEQQADVLGKESLLGTADDVHPAPKRLGSKLYRGISQPAADLVQEFLYQAGRKIIKRGGLIETIVEGNRGSQPEQLAFIRPLCAYRARTFANKVTPLHRVLGKADFSLVRPRLAARRPQHQDGASLDKVRGGDRMVLRLHGAVP